MELESYILAVVAISGTLLGAWLNARLASHAEERKWERERETRYHEKRLEVYTHYLALVDRTQLRMVAFWAKNPKGFDRSSDEYQGLLQQLTQDGYEASTRAIILGTTEVNSALTKLHMTLLNSLGESTKQEQQDSEVSYLDAREHFLEAVRRELGIAAGTK
jgi:hypothetical protein